MKDKKLDFEEVWKLANHNYAMAVMGDSACYAAPECRVTIPSRQVKALAEALVMAINENVVKEND